MKKYSASIFCFVIAAIFLAAHLYLGWSADIIEAESHNERAILSEYLIFWGRDVTENIQSEFLQLGFQFWILAGGISLFVTRIRAYEEDNKRIESKLDTVLENQKKIMAHLGLQGVRNE